MTDPEIARQFDEIARAVLGGAPDEWTAGVLTAAASTISSSCEISYSRRGGESVRELPRVDLFELARAVRSAHGWPEVNLELTCEPSGAYRVIAFHQAIEPVVSEAGHIAVLNPALPPEPGIAQAGPAGRAPAGDATTAADRLRNYVRRRAELVGDVALGGPASSADIAEAERRLGVRLPDDLRALYEVADGDGDSGIFDGYVWLPLAQLVEAHRQTRDPVWFGWSLGWEKTVLDASPPHRVRRCSGHPGWLPFAFDYGGNYLAVDMSPAAAGRPGQVIRIGRDHDERPGYVTESVTGLLATYLDMLDRGAHDAGDGYLEFLPDPPSSDDTHFLILNAPPLPLDPGTLTAMPQLQAIYLNRAGVVDLTPLTAVTSLRVLRLNRSVAADLTPLRDLPLESLRLTVPGGDLAPLAGHPTLRNLAVVTDGGDPVRVGALRDVPELDALDLSGADVADLGTIGELTGLRYLALRPEQWDELGRPPAGLLAARRSGTGSLRTVLDWAAGLGLDVSEAMSHTGTVTPD